MSAADAAALVRPDDTLAIPLGPGAPGGLLHALGERDDWKDLEVFGALLLDLYTVFTKPGVHLRSGFFGPAERVLRDAGANVEFVPADFRRFVTIAEQFAPRVMTTAPTPPDEHGFMSLVAARGRDRRRAAPRRRRSRSHRDRRGERAAAAHDRHPAASSRTRCTSTRSTSSCATTVPPFVLADDAADRRRSCDRRVRARVHRRRAARCRPGSVACRRRSSALLADGPGGDYGVHSEMFTTGLMHLHQAGKVTNARKGEFAGVSIATFALGTAELYAWLDGNADVRFLPVDVVNAPDAIARNHHVVSINGALAVDLYGQVVADRLQRPPVLRDRRPRGLRRAVGPRARGPFADLPAVDRASATACTVSRIVSDAAAGHHGHDAAAPGRRRDHRVRRRRAARRHDARARRRARRDRASRLPRRAARAAARPSS